MSTNPLLDSATPTRASGGPPVGGVSIPGLGNIHTPGARQEDVVQEVLSILAEAKANQEKVGTWDVYIRMGASRGLRNREIPWTLSVLLSGGKLHPGSATTTWFCERLKGKETTGRWLTRGPGEWKRPLTPGGCGAVFHPDDYRGSTRPMTCPQCGLQSIPAHLVNVKPYTTTVGKIGDLVEPVLLGLKEDVNLVLHLWHTDRSTWETIGTRAWSAQRARRTQAPCAVLSLHRYLDWRKGGTVPIPRVVDMLLE